MKPWTDHNFPGVPAYQPLMGIIEELGELSHALLKKEQGIRGKPEELRAKAADAIGDITIYLGHYCNIKEIDFERDITYQANYDSTADALFSLTHMVSDLLLIHQSPFCTPQDLGMTVEMLVSDLNGMASHLGFTYTTIVKETWEHVRGRDWVANPESGK